jgi:hypothetical protein
VDSGCDFTTFPLEWAKSFGIDPERACLEQTGSTAGGSAPQYLYVPGVRATFLGKTLLLGAIFAPLCPHVLLGRQDFFRYFKSVQFDQENEELLLEGSANWPLAVKAVRANIRRLALDAHSHVNALVGDGDRGRPAALTGSVAE